MNQVAAALVGRPVYFGLIPCGSGNGLARDLGLPLRLEEALEVLREARIRVIDTGRVGGKAFFNVAGFGLDAEIAALFNSDAARGLLSYFRIGMGALLRARVQALRVEPQEGVPWEGPAFVTALANSTQYGNNLRIAPRARLDDGRLDVVVVPSRNPLLAFWLGARAFAGTLDRARCVRSFQSERLVLHRAAEGALHTDGEVHFCGKRLEVVTLPGSLRVLVPTE